MDGRACLSSSCRLVRPSVCPCSCFPSHASAESNYLHYGFLSPFLFFSSDQAGGHSFKCGNSSKQQLMRNGYGHKLKVFLSWRTDKEGEVSRIGGGGGVDEAERRRGVTSGFVFASEERQATDAIRRLEHWGGAFVSWRHWRMRMRSRKCTGSNGRKFGLYHQTVKRGAIRILMAHFPGLCQCIRPGRFIGNTNQHHHRHYRQKRTTRRRQQQQRRRPEEDDLISSHLVPSRPSVSQLQWK